MQLMMMWVSYSTTGVRLVGVIVFNCGADEMRVLRSTPGACRTQQLLRCILCKVCFICILGLPNTGPHL